MSDISEWSTKEPENTHIDELTLSGESGQYINKVMCAVKKAIGDLSIAFDAAVEGSGVLPVSVGGTGHGEYLPKGEASDFNTYTTAGKYHLKFTSSTQNAPIASSSALDCVLTVERIEQFSGISSSKRTIQYATVLNPTYSTSPRMFVRKGFDSANVWSGWYEIKLDAVVDAEDQAES